MYKNFLEQDLSREEREKRRERVLERKAEWEKRGREGREEKLTESRVDECKEDSYKRETNGIGRVDEEI